MEAPLRSRPAGAEARHLLESVRTLGGVLTLAVLPALLLALFLLSGGPARGFDFHQFWQGGRDLLDGVSPYPGKATLPAPAIARGLDPTQVQQVFGFPYPAPTALAIVPLALLPVGAATALMLALLALAIPASLALLGVRDWRCYGAAFLWMPVLGSIRLGTLTPLLILGTAAAWRFRERRLVVAALVAALVVAKLFLWPLLIWLAATRRKTAGLSAAFVAAVTLASWAVIGFTGFSDYPALVRRLGDAVGWKSYSITALAEALGFQGTAIVAIAGAALIGSIVFIGRRADGDAAALTLAILAAVACTPIVWLHYFALALVPVAISSRRLNGLWLAPLGFWLTPYQEADGRLWTIAVGLLLFGLTVGTSLMSTRRLRAVTACAIPAIHER